MAWKSQGWPPTGRAAIPPCRTVRMRPLWIDRHTDPAARERGGTIQGASDDKARAHALSSSMAADR